MPLHDWRRIAFSRIRFTERVHALQRRTIREGTAMTPDLIKTQWLHLRVKLKKKWARLTDDDLGALDGHREYLVGRLQERYGIAKEKAQVQVKEFERSL
jgi:uncharacterized protein YjbJ (UPF0337 family)